MTRFGPSEYIDYDEAFTHIKQTGTLQEYQKEFEKLTNHVHDWPEKTLVGAFIEGLKSDLISEVRVYCPKTYLDTAEIVRLDNDHLSTVRKGTQADPRRTNTPPFENRSGGGRNFGNTNSRATPPEVK